MKSNAFTVYCYDVKTKLHPRRDDLRVFRSNRTQRPPLTCRDPGHGRPKPRTHPLLYFDKN